MSLGSIVVRLTANTADFETDLGRAAKAAEKRAKEIDASIRKAGVAIGAALGTAIVGLGAAVKKSIDHMDEMAKASARVGQSTEEFSKLVYAGSLADVQMEALVSTMGKLTKAQAAALDSGSKQAKMFDALGISVKNADGSLRSSNDVLLDFADRFKELGGSQEAIAAGFEIFGRSFQDIIPLIKDGADGLRAAYGEAEAFGKVVDSEAAAAAEKFNDDLTRLQSGLEGVVMEIAQGMLPHLTSMTDGMVSAGAEMQNMRDFGDGLGSVINTLGGFFGYVSSQVRQLGVDISATIEAMRGLNEMSRLDFSGGYQTIRNAVETRNQMRAEAEARANLDAARAGLNNTMRGLNYVSYDGPLLSGMDSPKKANGGALRSMFGGSPKRSGGGRKSGGGGISRELQEQKRAAEEAQREMERVAAAQDRWNASILDLEASLAGPLAEAQREYDKNMRALNDAFAKGEVTLADYAKGEEAYAAALKKSKDEISGRKTPAEEMLADMQFEIELLGKTREQQELLTAARYLGAEATTEAGKAAIAAMADYQRLNEQMQEQIGFMDEFRGGMSDALVDLVTGAKSAKEAFADFFDDMAAKITRMIAERWIEQLFGKQGSTGGGTQGGNWLGMIFQGLFGGARAGGGPVDPNRAYLVGERGPELIVPRTAGLVLNTQQTGAALAGGGGISQVNQFHFAAPTDPRTQVQMAARVAFETKRATRRNG